MKRILIANRGEIALRILRAARLLNLEVCFPYSQADSGGPWLNLGDFRIPLSRYTEDTYLNKTGLIQMAKDLRCDGIHPGYGFLSENSDFADGCEKAGLVFIGPNSKAINQMGNKIQSRKIMEGAGVPVVPGFTFSKKETLDSIKSRAEGLGFPVLVKAASGGGGRGMRVVHEPSGLESAMESAGREAENAFGDPTIYIEKYIQNPRHIEIQVMGDKTGKSLHFFERECSIQRRHQKLIEEAPSTFLDENLRKQMGETAVKAANSIHYDSAGTVEFVAGMADGKKVFYFLEVNTRIQVEHPITELITGVDLVKTMIQVAYGKKIPFEQESLNIKGWAVECRINAENPFENFRPTSGTIQKLRIPGGPGIRWDSAVREGYTLPTQYDSMIGKLIAWGSDRNEAHDRLSGALSEFFLDGFETSADFCQRLINHPTYREGQIHTHLIPNLFPEIKEGLDQEKDKFHPQAALLAFLNQNKSSPILPDRRGMKANPWNKFYRYDLLKSRWVK